MHMTAARKSKSTVALGPVLPRVKCTEACAGPLETGWLKMNPHQRVHRGFLGEDYCRQRPTGVKLGES